MWIVDIYSEGDLLQDSYLQRKKRIEKSEDGSLFETYEDAYSCSEDIHDRLDFINSCIDRLSAEKELLLKYGDKLINLGSYENLK